MLRNAILLVSPDLSSSQMFVDITQTLTQFNNDPISAVLHFGLTRPFLPLMSIAYSNYNTVGGWIKSTSRDNTFRLHLSPFQGSIRSQSPFIEERTEFSSSSSFYFSFFSLLSILIDDRKKL